MRAVVAVWLALALLASGCAQVRSGARSGTVEAGRVERLQDGEWQAATRVGDGDRLRVVEDSMIRSGTEVLLLLSGTEASLEGDALVLTRGDALIQGQDLVLRTGDTLVTGTGAIRVRAGVTPRVAVYRGGAEVIRPGERQRLNALRELTLAARRFDGTDRPLAYAPDDLIDQRILPEAIVFDLQIASLVTAIDAAYGQQPQPPTFYTSFVAVDEPDVITLAQTAPTQVADGSVGPPADALVGLFVTRAVADARGDGDLLAAAASIRALRDEGALWGLVAVALGVTGVDFAGIVDRAVEQRAVVAAAAPVPQAPVAAAPPAPRPAQPGDTTPDVPPPAPAPEPTPDPPAAPPAPEPGPVQQILTDVLDLLDPVLGR